MDGFMEEIKKITEKNSTRSGKKFSYMCGFCNKEFDSKEYLIFGRDKICSEDCKKKKEAKNREEYALKETKRIIPLKYQSITTDKIDLLRSSTKESLFITGVCGTGKTVFASSMAKAFLNCGCRVKWVCYPTFIMSLQNAFKDEHQSAYKIAEAVAEFDGVLIIDDLGAEKLTEFVRQITYFIINHREQYCLRTMITSNFSLSDIDEQIDPRISSRIAGMCKVVKFSGKDKRLERKEIRSNG